MSYPNENESWIVLPMVFAVCMAVVAIAIVSYHSIDVHHQEVLVEQKQRSERGHWLWGTKVGEATEIEQIKQDGKSDRGHWIWGHLFSRTTPSEETKAEVE